MSMPVSTTLQNLAYNLSKKGAMNEDEARALVEFARDIPANNHYLNMAFSVISRYAYGGLKKGAPGWTPVPLHQLPTRARNVLYQALGLQTVYWEDFPSPGEILNFRNCGPESVREIKKLAKRHGLEWSEYAGRWCAERPKK